MNVGDTQVSVRVSKERTQTHKWVGAELSAELLTAKSSFHYMAPRLNIYNLQNTVMQTARVMWIRVLTTALRKHKKITSSAKLESKSVIRELYLRTINITL